MYTFVKTKLVLSKESTPIDYGWTLKISDVDELIEYHKLTTPAIVRDALQDGLDTNWGKSGSNKLKSAHYTNVFMSYGHYTAEIKGDMSPVDGLVELLDSRIEGQIKTIESHGAIYIQRSGGYFYDNGNVKEYGRKKKVKDPVFPNSGEAKFLQWRGGKHWYVKVDGIDVVDKDGNQKWDTKYKARKALEWWRINT